MTTAANLNKAKSGNPNNNNSTMTASITTSGSGGGNSQTGTTEQQQQQAQAAVHDDAGGGGVGGVFNKLTIGARAIGNLLPNSNHHYIFTQKYTLPDKTVASQVLMYRQLLHCKCRSGLRLSRPYEATAAQKAVLHMPWWEQQADIAESGKMVISYDNLIVRLWINGAVMPFADLLGATVDTMIDDKGLPPIPHPHWVHRLGFQQPDPVTDFRSGGILSLAMMVHMVESCMPTVQRFYDGDAAVLPFGITCINVTDMMAKFLMLAKSTDKMEALMSQKPFWRMFADPNAILACQEISMNMLADVVVEMNRERKIPHKGGTAGGAGASPRSDLPRGMKDDEPRDVTVFDFDKIMERTERRVRDDLLGAGPQTVDELRSIAGRLRLRYEQQLAAKERNAGVTGKNNNHKAAAAAVVQSAENAVAGASSMAVGVFEKIKTVPTNIPNMPNMNMPNVNMPNIRNMHMPNMPSMPAFSNPLNRKKVPPTTAPAPMPTMVDLPPPTPDISITIPDFLSGYSPPSATAASTEMTTPQANTTGIKTPEEGSWHGVSKSEVPFEAPPFACPESQFSIGDDDDDL